MAHGFLGALHGLRGLMAVWVVGTHVSPAGWGGIRVTSYGYLAVDVFFILSGLLLMRTHGATLRWDRRAVLRFLLLRWWRTYPLYACSMVLSLGVVGLFKDRWPAPEQVLGAVLLLEGWAVEGVKLNTPVWSLGVEWLGYLAFPAVASVCGRMAGWRALAGIVAVLLVELAVVPGLAEAYSGGVAVVRMAAGVACGALLAACGAPAEAVTGRRDAALLAVIVAMVAVLSLAPDVWCAPLLVALVWLVAWPGPATTALLTARLPLFLGRISFALYLCHFPILKLVQAVQPAGGRMVGLAGTLVAVAVVVVVATVLCRVVEEPLRRVGRANRTSG